MAKRKAQKPKHASARSSKGRKRVARRVSGKRPIRKGRAARPSAKPKTSVSKKRRTRPAARLRTAGSPSKARRKPAAPKPPLKTPHLDRVRRTLEESVQQPPSSLDMERRGTAVRTGRAEVAQSLMDHRGMSPAITGGDVDVDLEDAYFTGDEAPGGDNPTPDQDVVDDIGRALGVEYQDNEELKAVDKVTERDKRRWELDPASSEDYKERK